MTDWMTQLCTHVGVHAQYRGFEGQRIHVSRATQHGVLQAMGFEVETERDAENCVKQLQTRDAARPLPLEVIVQAGVASTLTLAHPAAWQLEAEGSGETLASGRASKWAEKRLSLPPLNIGIHRLRLSSDGTESTTWVLARPACALQLNDRIWGALAALYGLTDGATAQIGSYGLLGKYAAAIAKHGADFIGVNPVHAMGQVRPDDVISPYSPSHRAFFNTWHCTPQDGARGDTDPLLNYPAALKANAQARCEHFAAFDKLPNAAPEKQQFDAYCTQAGAALDRFALFEALSTCFGADWRDWPQAYRDHDEDALALFAAKHGPQITQTKWTQWRAENQLSNAQTKAKDAGMRVGLYLDLAVGPRLGGAETWEKDSALITGATLGAPPDPLGPLGQSWGLAPLSPLKCREEGYAGFSRLLRASMRHAGMIRMDHILGLMRSFWIPLGGHEGTYVSYPFEALLAVIAIESVRNNTIVVGEDLGLVPEGLREKLAASGIYGLDVLQYMRTETGGFVDPKETRAMAICSFATHDTPTVAGFFAAEDARVRHAFDGLDAETLEQTRADRDRALKSLKTKHPVAEIHRRLAQSNARMVAIQLDDIAAQTAQQNLPGTVDTYPNWRLKAPLTIDEIASSDGFAKLAKDMGAQGRSNLSEWRG